MSIHVIARQTFVILRCLKVNTATLPIVLPHPEDNGYKIISFMNIQQRFTIDQTPATVIVRDSIIINL
jgi:hypothetical protein